MFDEKFLAVGRDFWLKSQSVPADQKATNRMMGKYDVKLPGQLQRNCTNGVMYTKHANGEKKITSLPQLSLQNVSMSDCAD